MGLSFDERTGFLFVAGGRSGRAHVYDTATGAVVATYDLCTSEECLINDVVVTARAAFLTDYLQCFLYCLPLTPDGQLPSSTAVHAAS